MFIEGRRLVDEAVRSKIRIIECFVSEDLRDTKWLQSIAPRLIRISELPEKIFRSLADTASSQGIVAIAERPKNYSLPDLPLIVEGSLPLVLFLNELNNPSNLGAVMRTAEAAGVSTILVSKDSADVFGPKALRAAMGAAFRVHIAVDVDLDDVVRWAANHKLLITAADIGGNIPYTDVDWSTPRILIFGSEAHGLSEQHLKRIDEKVVIPMSDDVESLNVAVSVGIVLFEARRQNANYATLSKIKA
jgi:TrmH family RNA methyltransferase